MRVHNPFIVIVILAIAALAAPWARAQVVEGAPIVIHKKPPSDKNRFKGEVISATNSSITVRDAGNDRRIRTFSYSPALGGKMKKVMDRGGYQPGDKVDVRYHSRTGQAWDVKGKPSVPR